MTQHCTVLYCSLLYCTVLHCTVLYCTVLYCTVLYCTVLHCTVLYFTVLNCVLHSCTALLYCIVLYCTVLYCAALYCIVLYCAALYCILLYCIVLYCAALCFSVLQCPVFAALYITPLCCSVFLVYFYLLSTLEFQFKAFGGAGLSSDYPLATFFTWARVLRLADGPDEVHKETIAKMEIKKSHQSRLWCYAAEQISHL